MSVTVVLHVERFFAVMPRLAGVWLEAALCQLRVEDERRWLGRFTYFSSQVRLRGGDYRAHRVAFRPGQVLLRAVAHKRVLCRLFQSRCRDVEDGRGGAAAGRAAGQSRDTGCAADEVFCTLRFTSEVPASGEVRWELRCAILRPSAPCAILQVIV